MCVRKWCVCMCVCMHVLCMRTHSRYVCVCVCTHALYCGLAMPMVGLSPVPAAKLGSKVANCRALKSLTRALTRARERAIEQLSSIIDNHLRGVNDIHGVEGGHLPLPPGWGGGRGGESPEGRDGLGNSQRVMQLIVYGACVCFCVHVLIEMCVCVFVCEQVKCLEWLLKTIKKKDEQHVGKELGGGAGEGWRE